MKQTPLLKVNDLTVAVSGKVLLEGVGFTVNKGENLAVIGDSGSGKSALVKTLAGKYFSKGSVVFNGGNGSGRIVVIPQQHNFKNLSNTASFYYQQRFNSCDTEDALRVNDALLQTGATQTAIDENLLLLNISHIQTSRLIQLSNGEHKRFQLAKALLQDPQWLFLDSPYTGLDIEARQLLNEIIDKLTAKGISILLVTSFTDIPASITQVVLLDNGKMDNILSRNEFDQQKNNWKPAAVKAAGIDTHALSVLPQAYEHDPFSVAIRMIDTSVVYGDKKILDNINWEVKKGECWSISGHNGSGKSTLLSLVNGDNPQAFANEIYLFDKRKGSGETIWNIKQKIGYISPELHHYFEPSASCYQVVASGLFDTIGLFRKLSKQQQTIVEHWMDLFKIKILSQRLFKQLSNGEQRLVLLARALVKNPPLLILDEPCQGLDAGTAAQFIALIDEICVLLQKTLIYVSHYEEEIPSCVTKNLQLKQGRIAA